jgi:hypothetical protein
MAASYRHSHCMLTPHRLPPISAGNAAVIIADLQPADFTLAELERRWASQSVRSLLLVSFGASAVLLQGNRWRQRRSKSPEQSMHSVEHEEAWQGGNLVGNAPARPQMGRVLLQAITFSLLSASIGAPVW